jgi:DNA-binding NarL/FixJ family response regulator
MGADRNNSRRAADATLKTLFPERSPILMTMTVLPEKTTPTETSPRKKRILIADDHPIFRRGVANLIATVEEFELVAEASTPQETLTKVRELPVDLALLDLSFQGGNGFELTKQIRAEKPDIGIILLSMHDEDIYAIRGLKSGAQGYVMKREKPAILVEALRRVASGSIYVSPKIADSLVYRSVQTDGHSTSPLEMLTERQLQVLRLFGEGHSTQEVANRLQLGAKTIETHRLHIKEKLGFPSAPEMVRFAVNWVRLQNSEQEKTREKGT